VYDSIRQLFTGVQVAGPRLTPSAMDKGYHAIPHVPSNDPQTPACFYEQGDYTCIKDAMMEHWDRTATNGYAGAQGCYRMAQGGLRHPTGDFPTGNLSDRFRTDDPCNSYGTNYNLNPNPPSTNNPVP
jgi:hypothetical protein